MSFCIFLKRGGKSINDGGNSSPIDAGSAGHPRKLAQNTLERNKKKKKHIHTSTAKRLSLNGK